jgi:hypothetical protein
MSCHMFGDMWIFCHRIFTNMFAMSSQLFSEMWTICHMIFGHLRCHAACSAKCGRFVTGFFDTFAIFSWFFSKMWMFCRISGHICDVQGAVKGNVDVCSQDVCKNTDGAARRKYSKTVPLNDMWTTPCLGRAVLLSLSSYTAL